MCGNAMVFHSAINICEYKSQDQKREHSDQRTVVNGSGLLGRVVGAALCPWIGKIKRKKVGEEPISLLVG